MVRSPRHHHRHLRLVSSLQLCLLGVSCVSDAGGRSSIRGLHPVQPRHSRPAGLPSGHQHVRLISGNTNTTVQLFPVVKRRNRKLLIHLFTVHQDANIPFPRTSGARFCGTGCLVYFTRPITMHRSAPPTEPTPRYEHWQHVAFIINVPPSEGCFQASWLVF